MIRLCLHLKTSKLDSTNWGINRAQPLDIKHTDENKEVLSSEVTAIVALYKGREKLEG